jgi:predicted  nucleic acid-binding Zn-ribbon protein
MSEKVQITREVYQKNVYKNVIDTEFSQLIQPITQIEEEGQTIEEFFQSYSELFFEIPKTGDIDSHEYIVKQSIEYLGDEYVNPLIEELQNEITSLKEQLLKTSEVTNDLTSQLSSLSDTFQAISSQTNTVASTTTTQ